MGVKSNNPSRFHIDGVPHWLFAGGINTLMLIIIGGGVAGFLYLLNLSSSISVPLIIAFVIAIIAHPLMKLGDRIHLPRAVSALIVIALVIGVVWASVQITVVGVVDQAPAIGSQLINGIKGLGKSTAHLLEGWGVKESDINTAINSLISSIQSSGDSTSSAAATTAKSIFSFTSSHTEIINKLMSAVAQGFSNFTDILSSVGNFAFSAFIGLMLLYYLLTDYERIMDWIGDHLGVEPKLGEGLISDASDALRGYFKATTITAVFVAVGIGIALSIMKVPLVVPIMIVTFLTAYIPFFGAIISGVFACLIALGSGGLTSAIIALVIVLLMQNVLQAVISAKFTGDSLDLHPLVVLAITILGSSFGGLLGTTLAAPGLAMFLKARRRFVACKAVAVDPDEEAEITTTSESDEERVSPR